MRRSTSTVRRACAVGTTIALVGLTTGLGIMTATAASAVEPTATTTDAPAAGSTDAPAAGSTGDQGAPAAGTTPTDGASTPTASAPAANTPAATETPAPTEPTTAPTTPARTPSSIGETLSGQQAPQAPKTTPDADQAAVQAAQTAVIAGDLSVGSRLTVETEGFTTTNLGYRWIAADGSTLATTPYYVVDESDAGTVLSVQVTGVGSEGTTASTDGAIAPEFATVDGAPIEDPEFDSIQAVAGEAFSRTYAAVGAGVTYSVVAQTYDEETDDVTESTTLPKGVSFDAATGTLRGTLTSTDASPTFIITATAGGATADLVVDVSVSAGAPVGIKVATTDVSVLDGEDLPAWIIEPDGTVLGGSAFDDETDYRPSGNPTVAQGGTLVVYGSPVDRFGNETDPVFDEETGDISFARTTVTSDVASDVVEQSDGYGPDVAQVTFPHASTHTLTVSSPGIASTSFAVEVVPTATAPTTPALTPAAPVAAAAPVSGHGRLAYTGADESTPLAWALGLLVAGAGLIGARTLRRRRAQR